jgi:hypothetical protein
VRKIKDKTLQVWGYLETGKRGQDDGLTVFMVLVELKCMEADAVPGLLEAIEEGSYGDVPITMLGSLGKDACSALPVLTRLASSGNGDTRKAAREAIADIEKDRGKR